MMLGEDSRIKIPGILHRLRLGYRYLSLKNAIWDEETNSIRPRPLFCFWTVYSLTAVSNALLFTVSGRR